MSKTGRKIFKGTFWTGIELVVNRGFGFLIKLVLARILFPEDFGLVGMAAVFTTFVQVFSELGMGSALVQRDEKLLKETHFHTAFWTGVIWSILIFLIMCFVVTPLASWFYEQPMLNSIIPVLSLGILASPVNMIHKSQLTKALDFKKMTIINNSSNIVSGSVALILALTGAGVWALVFNSVANSLIAIPLYFKATGWKPKLIWDKTSFKDIFGFGAYYTGTKVFNKITSQIDYLIVGKLLGAASLGIYTLAFVLTETIRSQLMSIVNKVMYPVYSSFQNDTEKLKDYYLKVLRYNALLIYPVLFFLAVFAEPFVLLVYGDKWAESVPIVQIISIASVVHMLVNSNTSLIRGSGRPKLELILQLVKSLMFFVPLIIAGTYYYGLIGTAIGYAIAKTLAVILSVIVMTKIFGIDFKSLMKAAAGPFFTSFIPATISYIMLVFGINPFICFAGFTVTLGLIFYFFWKKELLQIKKLRKSKSD